LTQYRPPVQNTLAGWVGGKREYSKPCLAFRCLASRPLPLSRHRIRGTVLKLLRRSVSVFILAPAWLEYLEETFPLCLNSGLD
jgi:hypothetical protein